MFAPEQLRESLSDDLLATDLTHVRGALASHRLKQESLLDPDAQVRLMRIVEAVLASAPTWQAREGLDVVRRAAEVAELLAVSNVNGEASRDRLRAALLYELAGQPMMAAALVSNEDGPALLIDFFRRRGAFRSLAGEADPEASGRPAMSQLLRFAACESALSLAKFEHDPDAELNLETDPLEVAARSIALDMSLTDVKAFNEVVGRRADLSTRLHTPRELLPGLEAIGFPPELWHAQAEALDAGLLDVDRDAWGLAAPTGTGKTFLARLVILHALARRNDAKVLYLVPSKALVYQVSQDLSKALQAVGVAVTAVTPQLAALEGEEQDAIAEASVLVLTPEKADMLLRIGSEFLRDVALVIVDEAHHLEDGTRGVLLELYLARMRHALADQARYVLLSAVAPNIREVAEWMGDNPGAALISDRSTRMKVGIYRVRLEGGRNRGLIDYVDGTQLRLFERGVASGQRKRLVQLAEHLAGAGPVLIISEGPGSAESVAAALKQRLEENEVPPLSTEELASPTMQRLDSRLEREMYAGVGLRELIRHRVAYHHAGLPPRVREALEDAISENYIQHVVATTTLADGVNFPFSTVIVESLAIRNPTFEAGTRMTYRAVTPRTFWNIAGRAGRPGYDHEGQVILFEMGLGLERVGATIDPYTKPDIEDIPPVTSALATGLAKIYADVERGDLDPAALENPDLPDDLPKATQGVVNLLRVGLAHARATGINDDVEEYFDSTFAARRLPESERAFARRLLRQQQEVLDAYLENPDSASVKMVAELGLSISTLSGLQQFVKDLQDWQLEKLTHVVRGGRIDFEQLPYLLRPVLARMAELEGVRLNGWYSQIVVDWCSGKPFAQIERLRDQKRLEDLIKLMYSRIQYILPWGLYATDRFVEEEATLRGMAYAGEVNQLAYLVDAGVPDWAALKLTMSGFERTDAARLARVYWQSREARETADIFGWIGAQNDDYLARIVRGSDRRRLDYDFQRMVDQVRGTSKP